VKQENLLTWFRWLTQWVRQALRGQNPEQKPVKILERIYSYDQSIVMVSVERDAPGAVATWYLFQEENPRNKLLITLDNLAAIRLGLRRDRQLFNEPSEPSSLELSLVQYDPVIRTHRMSIQWLIRLDSSRTVFSLIGTWDADLQGDSFDPDAKGITIIRSMAQEALNLMPLPGILWRSRMNKFPWTESVESYAHSIIGERHKCYISKLNMKVLKELQQANSDS
jgi:hypothetical protein